ncbi:hypothetical protein Cni_G16108 [Canna indica]|uniref:Photosynthetic NDH subunit of lumenal location 3, chloroplastic n=1 Tax=Canna indica TaxID=4628 RepID=A0AAQ3KEQ1_9LILI|nr:hypothetical protein Cni_G16108 [Canna indica]
MERKGCICRIRECVFDLMSMEEDLVEEEDEGAWELMASDLRLKSTFLYCDLNQVIANAGDEDKKFLTDLANRLFYSIEELDLAVKSRSISMTQLQYKHAVDILQEVMAALMPLHQVEY